MAQGRHAWPALDRRPVQGRGGDVARGRSVRLPRLERKSAREAVPRRAGARREA
jgi:hypothetical protein